MTDKVVKRGYVKWIDDDGVFHKEPLADHPELLKSASPKEQLAAEEARRLNDAAEDEKVDEKAEAEEQTLEVLAELKKAPDEVLTVADLDNDEPSALPSNEPLDPKLEELREKTS